MPRNGTDARHRLQLAALLLFEQNGFDSTTTAEIAAHAGLTERTFFRHFADKREVLFDGESALRQALIDGVEQAPARLAPMAALFAAFRAVAPMLEENRAFSQPRRSIILRTPTLQERLAAKTAGFVGALSEALIGRGTVPSDAKLAAEVGMAVLHSAADNWLDEPGSTLDRHLESAFARAASLTSLS